MTDDQMKLRIFGLRENQHVLATIFNQSSAAHRDLEYLEETAEHACSQANEVFGDSDPIYLDAELNAALFHLFRKRDYSRANFHLEAAKSAVKGSSATADSLLVKLLCALGINEYRRAAVDGGPIPITRVLSETLPEVFGKFPKPGDYASAVEIFSAMHDVSAEEVLLPHLLWQLGPAFVYELHAAGRGNDAIRLLEGPVLSNSVSVWGQDSTALRRVTSESRWLRYINGQRCESFPDLAARTKRHLQAAFEDELSALDDAMDTSRVTELFDKVRGSVTSAINAPLDGTGDAFSSCEHQIKVLLEELQEDGRYTEIMGWTDSFLGVASRKIDSSSPEEPTVILSPDERDHIASVKVGDVIDVPSQLLVPSQSCISREHLAWEIYYSGPCPKFGGVATSILIPALDALAALYDSSPDTEKKQASLYIRRIVLRVAHANCSSVGTISRMRLKLAQSLYDHARGDWTDVLRAILAHTDSLDFAESSGQFHRALRSSLRASASSWVGVLTQGAAFKSVLMDVMPGFGEAGVAFHFFSRDEYPIEWAQLLHGMASSALAHENDSVGKSNRGVDWDDGDDESDNDDELEEIEEEHEDTDIEEGEAGERDGDEDEESRLIASIVARLAEADAILDPVHFVEQWVDIQILRARALHRAGVMQNGLIDDPRDVLLRAKSFISHLKPSVLHQRVTIALAALDTAGSGKLTPPSFDGIERYDGRPEVQALMEIRRLGASLFERAKLAEAVPLFEAGLELGEHLLAQGRGLKSQRLIAQEIGLIAKSLAYCYHKQEQYAKAVATLERGKARLLLSSLEIEKIASALPAAGERDIVHDLLAERRNLVARLDSSIAFVEDVDRFVEVQSELNRRVMKNNPPSSSISLKQLSNIPEDSVVVWPLITEFGSVLYLIRPDISEELGEGDVVRLPELTASIVNGWLRGEVGPTWLDVYEDRNKSRLGKSRFRNALTALSKLMFDNIFDKVCRRLEEHGTRDIIFVATSGLQLLPLHSSSPNISEETTGAETTLIDRFSFRVVPSATILQVLEHRVGAIATKRGFVAGVSKYDNPRWPALPSAVVEAKSVSGLIGAHAAFDDEVTVELLSREVHGAQYVHIACHGANWATDPHFSSGAIPRAVLMLTRGGVSTREILATWDLKSAELVCLSACDTGLIDLSRPWDEAEGITNVMFRLGVRKIVASLWSVDDTSTALLMVRFYENLTSGGLRVENALRHAQNWLRSATAAELRGEFPHLYSWDGSTQDATKVRPFAHPYFWASFVTSG